MELPHLGQHCSEPSCKQLDYLPVKCDACTQLFCHEHMKYTNHNCPSAYKKNVQVPVCPLCNKPVPVGRDQVADEVVGAHMDRDCQSEPAQARRKIFANKCSLKGCRQKEVVPVLCPDCQLNFCLRHRHFADHKCEGKEAGQRRQAREAAVARQSSSSGSFQSTISSAAAAASKMFSRAPRQPPPVSTIQGSMSEDEAFARALAASMNTSPGPTPNAATRSLSQEEEDRQLALALQQSEREHRRGRSNTTNTTSSSSRNCNVS